MSLGSTFEIPRPSRMHPENEGEVAYQREVRPLLGCKALAC